MRGMYAKHPFHDSYWEDKTIKVENIKDVPLYLTASYSCVTPCSVSRITLTGFQALVSTQKVLSTHS